MNKRSYTILPNYIRQSCYTKKMNKVPIFMEREEMSSYEHHSNITSKPLNRKTTDPFLLCRGDSTVGLGKYSGDSSKDFIRSTVTLSIYLFIYLIRYVEQQSVQSVPLGIPEEPKPKS
ncbi:hypothetical protein KIN20_029696 [Parelaphostrongylus tenuis]|uniref:Uncharacterized protein n=1 Tax=Parelaphostrongylus tenuis TaxID=148309 RepID=A0AAD5WGB0_PARTN|nr:hypothetical protein KIN20_029696 [Parelaphostrongylus tenuis]